MTEAKKGNITPEMKAVAEFERIDADKILKGVANGTIVIPKNIGRDTKACGIGKGLTTKINANIGSSSKIEDIDLEMKKAKLAVDFGADAIMDLSTGPKLLEFRKKIMDSVDVPIGTVPIYEAGVITLNKGNEIIEMDEDDIWESIIHQAKDGVDFMTLHCGINKDLVDKLQKAKRMMGIVSRGGTFLASWILHNGEENPLYANYDYLLEIALEYDITLSLGDGLRPGCLSDATDTSQVPLNQIRSNMEIQKTLCHGAPFYVLGPIVTDLAPGYDHITSAIGGAIAASRVLLPLQAVLISYVM